MLASRPVIVYGIRTTLANLLACADLRREAGYESEWSRYVSNAESRGVKIDIDEFVHTYAFMIDECKLAAACERLTSSTMTIVRGHSSPHVAAPAWDDDWAICYANYDVLNGNPGRQTVRQYLDGAESCAWLDQSFGNCSPGLLALQQRIAGVRP